MCIEPRPLGGGGGGGGGGVIFPQEILEIYML